jgi:site-specific DNA recombinase
MENTQKQKAVGYCRVSTIGQKDGLSLSDQQHQIKAYCKRNEFELSNIYVEQASGKTDERIEFRKMLGDAAGRKFEVLVVTDNDRFGRNVEDRLRIRATLTEDFDIELHSISDGIFKNTPTGRFTDTIKSSVSEYYRDLQIEKSASALSHKLIDKGERNLGLLLFGLTWADDKKSAIKHPTEYLLLRKVIDLRLNKKWSFQRIAQYMNQQGYSYRGRKWTNNNVGYICSSKTEQYAQGKSSITFQNQTFEFSFPPLINKVELAKLKKLIPEYIVNGKKKITYLLTQKVVCGLCGAGLQHFKGGGYEYYTCRNKLKGERKGNRCTLRNIPQKWLDEEVWDQLRRLFKNQKHFEKVIMAANKELQKQVNELGEIEDRVAEIDQGLENNKAQIERVVDFIAEGVIGKEEVKKRVQKLRKQAEKLNKEKEELQAQELLLQKEAGNLSILEETRTWWWEKAESTKPEEKRILIEALVNKITVWPYDPKLTDEDELVTPAKVHVEIKGYIPVSIGDTRKRQGRRAQKFLLKP